MKKNTLITRLTNTFIAKHPITLTKPHQRFMLGLKGLSILSDGYNPSLKTPINIGIAT